jgi:hypothetical protein
MESGIRGAEAILSKGGGAYDTDAERRYERYLVARNDYYRAETRWPEAPFWRRRQQTVATPQSSRRRSQ